MLAALRGWMRLGAGALLLLCATDAHCWNLDFLGPELKPTTFLGEKIQYDSNVFPSPSTFRPRLCPQILVAE